MNEARIKRDVIVIGASAGGVRALLDLCAWLPEDLPASVGIVLHRSPWYATNIAQLYGDRARIRVREAAGGEILKHCTVYFAPPDQHMHFTAGGVTLWRGPKVHFVRPAVDVLFASAAASYGPRVVGVLLTGGGSDGAHGLHLIKRHGGLTLVQTPSEAQDPTMPLMGIREDSPDAQVEVKALPSILTALAAGRHIEQKETACPKP